MYVNDVSIRRTVAVAFLGAAAFFSVVFFSALGSAFLAAVGEAEAGFESFDSFLASFTVPEAPVRRVSTVHGEYDKRIDSGVLLKTRRRFCDGNARNVPLGREKSPFSSPEVMARLTWLLKAASDRLPSLLLALMYFWIA